jgi:hypothetical protein
MARQSPKSIRLKTYLPCLIVYPTGERAEVVADLMSVGFLMTKEQAIDFARVVLGVTQDWAEVEVTARRNTNHVTVSWRGVRGVDKMTAHARESGRIRRKRRRGS